MRRILIFGALYAVVAAFAAGCTSTPVYYDAEAEIRAVEAAARASADPQRLAAARERWRSEEQAARERLLREQQNDPVKNQYFRDHPALSEPIKHAIREGKLAI